MAMSSVLNTGLQGIQSGIRQLDAAAGDAARLNGAMPGDGAVQNSQPAVDGGADPGARRGEDLSSIRVDQIEAGVLVKANANTVEVASDSLGTLIDTVV